MRLLLLFLVMWIPFTTSFPLDSLRGIGKRVYPCLHRVIVKSRAYKVDDSHNHVHALDVARLANKIIPLKDTITPRIHEKVMVCALLHDTIDHKYLVTDQAREREQRDLSRFLRETLEYSSRESQQLQTIMSDMSYSKTVVEGQFILPQSIQEADPHTREIYHLVRQADLLSSYDVERMLQYKYHRLFTEEEHPSMENRMKRVYEDTVQTFTNRIQPLLSIPGLFPSPAAQQTAETLYRDCVIKMSLLERDWVNLYSPRQFQLYRVLPFPREKNISRRRIL